MKRETPLILIVDDDRDFLEVHKHVLSHQGFRVCCASNANEGLRKMDKEKPALVMTDLMMDSLDEGFSFSRRIKEDPRFQDVPILIVTAIGRQRGYDFAPRRPQDLEAMKADALLEKPVPPETLRKRITELIGASRTAGGAVARREAGP